MVSLVVWRWEYSKLCKAADARKEEHHALYNKDYVITLDPSRTGTCFHVCKIQYRKLN